MEPQKLEIQKLNDMVMCGDHLSVTKTELNMKEKPDENHIKDNEREKMLFAYQKVSATTSRTEKPVEYMCPRTRSEHVLRMMAKRQVRSLDNVSRPDMDSTVVPPHRMLIQAALGSFRWPPYLLLVWVLVLVVTHSLHCIVTVLEKALPKVRTICQYLKAWTEDSWRSQNERRAYPLSLAFFTGMVYTVYFGLFTIYSVALWSIEPLCTECDEKPSEVADAKVTNYTDEVSSKMNIKQQ